MDSQRQQKFSKLIKKDLSEIFQRELATSFGGAFVTISHVRVSPDLGVCNVYVSMLGAKKPAEVMEKIQDMTAQIRHQLAQRIRNQARIIPELRFYYDNTAEEAERIEKLIDSLNIPKDPDKER